LYEGSSKNNKTETVQRKTQYSRSDIGVQDNDCIAKEIQKNVNFTSDNVNKTTASPCHKTSNVLPDSDQKQDELTQIKSKMKTGTFSYTTRSRTIEKEKNGKHDISVSSQKKPGSTSEASNSCNGRYMEKEDIVFSDTSSSYPKCLRSKKTFSKTCNTASSEDITKRSRTSKELNKVETPTSSQDKAESNFECSLCKTNFETSLKLLVHLRDGHGWSLPSNIA